MKRYGLIGYPLSHSRSKVFFDELFVAKGLNDYSYENFAIESEQQVRDFIANCKGLCGLNITSPYKRLAHALCDELSNEAAETCSVNCIHFVAGRLIGYNTDVFGFVKTLEQLLVGKNVATALVLGTGGAASSAMYGFKTLGIQGKMIGRRGNEFFPNGYSDISAAELASFSIIVNCTPLGTWPNIDECPLIDYSALHKDQILFDMVYNPEITAFLGHGISAGCMVKNGMEMLKFQAMKAWEIWNGL
ncbi:MAG: shikimate dehydrogenase family protein [Flavobacteriales bacterium]